MRVPKHEYRLLGEISRKSFLLRCWGWYTGVDDTSSEVQDRCELGPPKAIRNPCSQSTLRQKPIWPRPGRHFVVHKNRGHPKMKTKISRTSGTLGIFFTYGILWNHLFVTDDLVVFFAGKQWRASHIRFYLWRNNSTSRSEPSWCSTWWLPVDGV